MLVLWCLLLSVGWATFSGSFHLDASSLQVSSNVDVISYQSHGDCFRSQLGTSSVDGVGCTSMEVDFTAARKGERRVNATFGHILMEKGDSFIVLTTNTTKCQVQRDRPFLSVECRGVVGLTVPVAWYRFSLFALNCSTI